MDVIATDGVADFSVQAVANRADVSHRTVYRYFPSREALLEGLTDFLDDPLRAAGLPAVPESLDEIVESIPATFEFFEANAPVIEAMVIVRLALGIEPTRSKERTEAFDRIVREEAPSLTGQQTHTYAMGLRSIASSQHWHLLTRRLELPASEAATVAVDSLRALIGEIRRRDARERKAHKS